MSCQCNNSRHRENSEHRCERNCNTLTSSANFISRFERGTVSKFCTRFINGRGISLTKNECAIELERNRIYQISFTYSLETEKCGSLEITPLLNDKELLFERTTVTNARDGKITASGTFTINTECFSLLTFRQCSTEAETRRFPVGQVSVVCLGRSCSRNRSERECEDTCRDKRQKECHRRREDGSEERCTGGSGSRDERFAEKLEDGYWLVD